MIDIKCGHCGSTDIQKASVIYEGGTSTGSSISGGSIGGKGAIASTMSSSQTNLAKKLAPPPRMHFISMIFTGIALSFFGFLAFIYLFLEYNGKVFGFSWLIIASLFGYKLFVGIKNNAAFESKFNIYNKMWFCHKCGNTTQI